MKGGAKNGIRQWTRRRATFLLLAVFGGILGSCESNNPAGATAEGAGGLRVQTEWVHFEQLMDSLNQALAKRIDCQLWYQQHVAPHRRILAHWLWGGAQQDMTEDELAQLSYRIDSLVTRHPAQADHDLGRMLCSWVQDPHTPRLLDSLQAHLSPKLRLEQQLQPALNKLRTLFPNEIPGRAKLGTIVMGYDPRLPLSYTYPKDELMTAVLDSTLYVMIGLDYFAGPDFPILHPELLQSAYFRQRFAPRYATKRILEGIISNLVHPPRLVPAGSSQPPTFLAHMLHEGIDLYLLHQLLPGLPLQDLLYWDAKQLEWAQAQEPLLYKHFLGLLFETQAYKFTDYLYPRPSVQMRGIPGGQAAPPYLGAYIGYQIISAYQAQHPGRPLAELVAQQDWQKLLKESGYKPAL